MGEAKGIQESCDISIGEVIDILKNDFEVYGKKKKKRVCYFYNTSTYSRIYEGN